MLLENNNDLSALFTRVRQYEAQLQLKASALNTLLQDTVGLDYGALEYRSSLRDISLKELPFVHKGSSRDYFPTRQDLSKDYGMGGGDESLSPIVHASSRANFDIAHAAKLTTFTKVLLPNENTSLQNKIFAKQIFHPSSAISAVNTPIHKSNFLEMLDSQIAFFNKIPLGTPVDGIISSGFGLRRSPFSGRTHRHEGLDIIIDRESTILSTANGTVIEAGYKGAYGLAVVIDHGNGIQTIYGHLSKLLVDVGQKVCRGEQLGLVGSTGRATGPHLHYEIRVGGIAKDPSTFVELASLLKVLGD